jgi:hypothetical protein
VAELAPVKESLAETWRPAPGFETHYEVSDQGRVRRIDSGRIRRPVLIGGHGGEYPAVNLSVHNHQTMVLIHRLVALAFLPAPERPGMEVNHMDGVKTNCAVTNLEWATARDNTEHAIRTGLRRPGIPPLRRGEDHPSSKLTAREVQLIRASTETRAELANRFCVSTSTIKAIRCGRNWKSLITTAPNEQEVDA